MSNGDVLRGLRDFAGEVLTRDDPGYDAARRPVGAAGAARRPQLVLRCRSVRDVAVAVGYARDTGSTLAVRSGGHCFAGRSSTDGVLIDVSGLDAAAVAADGTATVGAGVPLGRLYAALHAHDRTVPAGCGATVGVAGLVLGGGIGLLGRRHGLTCDRLLAATVVLADGSVVDCDDRHEPDLIWALRGAGGGQFGVVTSLRLATVAEPTTSRFAVTWPDVDPARVAAAWQAAAPDAPDEVSASLELSAGDGGDSVDVAVHAATTTPDAVDWLHDFAATVGNGARIDRTQHAAFGLTKDEVGDPRDDVGDGRLRSEFFSASMPATALAGLVALLGDRPGAHRRRLTFTPMGGAYNRVAPDATAFVHRRERFLLEHVGDAGDRWVDASWALAHEHGSQRVYPNFPDPLLDQPGEAYWGGNLERLERTKRTYDPQRLFTFPQGL